MATQSIRGSKAGLTVRQPDPPQPGELTQTPREIEGPYYRLGAPERSNLLEPGDKPDLVLSGRILNERGQPIPHATIALWSANRVGDYDMVGHAYHGWQITDAEGRYEFTTIIPGCYAPRDAKHFHVKVQAVSSPITTQLYVEGEPGNEDDDYYAPELLVHVSPPDENGVKHGSYDFD